MSFLTKSQREAIKTGDIREKNMMRMRIRQNFCQAIRDINTVARHHRMIEGKKEITNGVSDKDIAELVANLLYMVDNEYIDEDIIHMLLTEAEDNWAVEGSGNVHGARQEIGIVAFLEAFRSYDNDDEMSPPPQDLEKWDEFCSVVEEFLP